MPNKSAQMLQNAPVTLPPLTKLVLKSFNIASKLTKIINGVLAVLFVIMVIQWVIHGFNLSNPTVMFWFRLWWIPTAILAIYQVFVFVYGLRFAAVTLPNLFATNMQHHVQSEQGLSINDVDAKKIVRTGMLDNTQIKKNPAHVYQFIALTDNPGVQVRWVYGTNRVEINGQRGNNNRVHPTEAPRATTVVQPPIAVNPDFLLKADEEVLPRHTPASTQTVQPKTPPAAVPARVLAEKINAEAGKMLLDITRERQTDNGVRPERIQRDYNWHAYLFGLAPNDTGRYRSAADEKTILELLDNEVSALILEEVPAAEANQWRAEMITALNET